MSKDIKIEVIPIKPMLLDNKIELENIIKTMINKPSIQEFIEESFHRYLVYGEPMSIEAMQTAIKAAENEN